jgi:hypothetical protein
LSPKSLFERARAEANRYKYLESEKAGHDLGQRAIDDWHRRHWTIWLRHRWLEHLMGVTCWEEFEPESFGRLIPLFQAHRKLLDRVAEMARRGAENIDVLTWAAGQHVDIDLVVRMLIELRLNDIRCTRHCFAFARLTTH